MAQAVTDQSGTLVDHLAELQTIMAEERRAIARLGPGAIGAPIEGQRPLARGTDSPVVQQPGTLVEHLTELRTIMAEERRAIARLDLAAIDALTERKRSLAPGLVSAAEQAKKDPAVARLVTQVRVEISANSILLAAANEAIAVILGQDPNPGYDHRARRQTGAPQALRTLA